MALATRTDNGSPGLLASVLAPVLGQGVAAQPVAVATAELAHGLRNLSYVRPRTPEQRSVLALVTLHFQPLGLAMLDLTTAAPENDWPDIVRREFADAIASHCARDGVPPPTPSAMWNGLASWPPCLGHRVDVARSAVPVTVIVATRERPALLAQCLNALLDVAYPDFEIIVVDNAPVTSATHDLVARYQHLHRGLRYLREDRRGLAHAHNRALDTARGKIVAITDDDVIVDRAWLVELVAPFVQHARVAAATGLIVPAQLDTPAQVALEAHGRYTKGFEPRLFDLRDHRPADPLFPFTAGTMGAGANMAFRTEFLRATGGFDGALGAGTVARGGDDLAAFFRVVMAGHTLAYQPSAVVWHHHRRDPGSMQRQVSDYAIGLGAYLTSAVVHHPGALARLPRRLPGGVSLFSGREGKPDDAHLARLARRGLLLGPFAYAASRWRNASDRAGVKRP